MYYKSIKKILTITLAVFLCLQPTAVFAVPSDMLDFSENDINQYRPPSAAIQYCKSTSSSSGPVASFNPDPQAVAKYKEIEPLISKYTPLYQRAAQAERLTDWELLAGIHFMEFSLQRTNPTTNPNYRGVFQMNEESLRGNGVDPFAPPFDSGRELSDDELVTQARMAIRFFLWPKANTLGIDLAQPLSVDNAAKVIIGYKSGQYSVWLTGGADPNLHAYAWAGYDETPEHKLPMQYGPGSPNSDEQHAQNIPGVLMIWATLKGGSPNSSLGGCAANKGLQPVPEDRAALLERLNAQMNGGNLKLGLFYGNAATQKTDIENLLTIRTLQFLLIISEQSGVIIPVNSLVSDHGNDGGDHPAGRAVDIGYFGNGTAGHSADGDQLYTFIYNNRESLKVSQLIWKYPPTGYQCLGGGVPVDCQAYYGGDLAVHDGHIHVGIY